MKKIVSIALVLISVFFMSKDFEIKKASEVTDEEKFAMEYDVATQNPFVYVNYNKLISLFNSSKAIVYFGSSNDENSQTISKFLTETLKDKKTNNIYYYDSTKLSKMQEKQLLEILNSKLTLKIDKIKIPSLYLIKEGNVTSIVDELDHKELESQNDLSTDEKEQIRDRYIELLKE